MKKPILFLLLAAGLELGSAAPLTFTALPVNGALNAPAGTTTGWGYAITNSTEFWLVPLGLSNSGVVNGSLTDIFDYPVVDPGQTINQDYAFNPPAGFGNSLGLYEYTLPNGAPAGFIESGTFILTYQLYTDNPDLNPAAAPIGDAVRINAPFTVAIEPAAVPEPGTAGILGLGSAWLLFLYGRRKSWSLWRKATAYRSSET